MCLLETVDFDMAVPEALVDFKDDTFLNVLNRLNAKDGLIRLIPFLRDLDCVKYGTLTEEEIDIAHAMLYYRFYNKTIINEFKYFSQNAKNVGDGEAPQVSMLLFVSSDKSKKKWPEYVQRYAGNVENASIIQLDCPHYVYDYENVRISEEITNYLNVE